jgi:hypothetical protein
MNKKEKVGVGAASVAGGVAGGVLGGEVGDRAGFRLALKRNTGKGLKGLDTLSKYMDRGRSVGAVTGAAAGAAGAGYLLHKAMKKKAGVPMAVVGGVTGGLPPLGAIYGGVLGSRSNHPIAGAIGGAATGLIPPVGAAYGAILGYNKGKHKLVPKEDAELLQKAKEKGLKKKASIGNIYLEKIAGIGTLGKSLIRSKLGPALEGVSKGKLSNIESRSRIALGSKAKPDVLTGKEKSKHTEGVLNFIKKRAPSLNYSGQEANKVMAVAARAKKMGVV